MQKGQVTNSAQLHPTVWGRTHLSRQSTKSASNRSGHKANDTGQGSPKRPNAPQHSLFVIFRSYDLNVTLGLQLDTDLLKLLLNPHLLV